jgi:LuxR family maltose regulon positive regulatory protein
MEDETTTKTILQSKVHRPPVPADHVHRSHLLERLDHHRHSRPLTLVSAPAGYGKSVLISSWLEASDCPGAWISLDKNDNDLRQFIACFLAAVNRHIPEAGRKTHGLLNAAALAPGSVLAHSLIDDLERIEQPFILVLDDYHLIEEKSIHETLNEILKHALQSLHLVVATRHDPPLPLFRYRALGQMTEIRAKDLRFSIAETSAFLQNFPTIAWLPR